MNVPDEEIVEAVLQGDRELFGALVTRYQKPVYNLMFRYTGSQEQAADLTQDTFLKAFDQLWRFRKGKRVFPWLYTIGVNLAKDWYRKNGTQVAQFEKYRVNKLAEKQQFPLPVEINEQEEVVNRALAGLTADDREILVLRYKHDCTLREIAKIFKISESAAKMRVKRAITRLRKTTGQSEN